MEEFSSHRIQFNICMLYNDINVVKMLAASRVTLHADMLCEGLAFAYKYV